MIDFLSELSVIQVIMTVTTLYLSVYSHLALTRGFRTSGIVKGYKWRWHLNEYTMFPEIEFKNEEGKNESKTRYFVNNT